MCSSGSLYYVLMQILEEYKVGLSTDKWFNYKIRNRALLSRANVEFFDLHSEAH